MMEAKESEQSKIITTLREADVLFGRGPHLRQFSGNILFRKLIHEYSKDYQNSEDFSDKEWACWTVVQAIENAGGRFLCALDDKTAPSKGNNDPFDSEDQGCWTKSSQRKVLRKIKQAFRDHLHRDKRKSKSSGCKLLDHASGGTQELAPVKNTVESLTCDVFPLPQTRKQPALPAVPQPRSTAEFLLSLEQVKADNLRLSLQIEHLLKEREARARKGALSTSEELASLLFR